MLQGKPCQHVMSVRESQQMRLDAERATQTRMECPSRSSHKYLLLQVWCGLLTVAMVVMAALLTSIKPKSTEDGVFTLKPGVSPTAKTILSIGSSLSYIQLIKSPDNKSWQHSQSCESCFLVKRDNSIHCTKESLYFIYAQVAFSKYPKTNQSKSVILIRNDPYGKSLKKLVEGTFPHTTEGSVWVANIVNLRQGDSISINITGEFLADITFWGAYQLL